jgi:hypothetical protein
MRRALVQNRQAYIAAIFNPRLYDSPQTHLAAVREVGLALGKLQVNALRADRGEPPVTNWPAVSDAAMRIAERALSLPVLPPTPGPPGGHPAAIPQLPPPTNGNCALALPEPVTQPATPPAADPVRHNETETGAWRTPCNEPDAFSRERGWRKPFSDLSDRELAIAMAPSEVLDFEEERQRSSIRLNARERERARKGPPTTPAAKRLITLAGGMTVPVATIGGQEGEREDSGSNEGETSGVASHDDATGSASVKGDRIGAAGNGRKPATRQIDFGTAALPPILTSHLRPDEARWIGWTWERRSDDWTKPPIACGRGFPNCAQTNNPLTWTTYAQAVARVADGRTEGIGFCLMGANIGAVDLDDCFDWDTRRIAPWAQAIIDRAPGGTYLEITVSGTGLRLIGRASGASLNRKFHAPGETGEYELFRNAARYITISGLALGVTEGELTNIDALIDALAAEGRHEGNGHERKGGAPPSRRLGAKPLDTWPRLSDLDKNGVVHVWSREDIDRLIRDGTCPNIPRRFRKANGSPNRSDLFAAAVWWRLAQGDDVNDIIADFNAHPNGIAKKYTGRIKGEVARCAEKWRDRHAQSRAPLIDFSLLKMPGRDQESDAEGPEQEPRPSGPASGPGPGPSGPASPLAIPLSVDEWLARDLGKRDCLFGELLSTTSRGILQATTGLGKTMFSMDICMHIGAGIDFLHWRVPQPRPCLYIDGEMSRRLLQERIAASRARLGAASPKAYFFSKEDIDDFAPLNTSEGRRVLLKLMGEIQRRAGEKLEFIIFDSIMALLSGDMKENESWRKTLPTVNALTKAQYGQLWIHHTGHDTSRGYGDKTKEWEMDTVMHLDGIEMDVEPAFCLTFPKARERRPDNRQDFEDVRLALCNDQWRRLPDTNAPKRDSVSKLAIKFLMAGANKPQTFRFSVLPLSANTLGGPYRGPPAFARAARCQSPLFLPLCRPVNGAIDEGPAAERRPPVVFEG